MRNEVLTRRDRRSRRMLTLLGGVLAVALLLGAVGPGIRTIGPAAAQDDSAEVSDDGASTAEMDSAVAGATPIAVDKPAPSEVDGTDTTTYVLGEPPRVEVVGTPRAASPIDIQAELHLNGAAIDEPVEMDDSGVAAVEYRYLVSADRVSTSIHAELIDGEGNPAPGWSVSLNDAGPDLVDAEHVTVRSEFSVAVTVRRDDAADAETTARLRFTVTIDLVATDSDDASAFAAAAIAVAPSGDQQAATIDGPLFRAEEEGEFGVASVDPTGHLACSSANTYGPNNDGAVPGEILHYECTLPAGALATLSGTVSLTDGAADGWQFRLIYNTQVLSLITTVDSGWTTNQQTLSGLAALSGGSMRLFIDLRAPTSTLTPSANAGDSRATLVISNARSSSGCAGPCIGSATINAYAAMTANSSGGGQLLGSISSVAGLTPGQALFAIACEDVPDNHVVVPGTQVAVNCQFQSLAALSSLLGAATVSANLTLTATNAGWDFALAPGQNADLSAATGHVLSIPLGPVINVGAFNNGWFTVFFTPTGYCGPVTAVALDSMMIEAAYTLKLASLVTVPVSNGYAVVPVQVAGDGDVPFEAPVAALGSGLDFGTFTYNGSGYDGGVTQSLNVALSAPASGCLAGEWYVTAQYAPMTGYTDAGHGTALDPPEWIPVDSLSYTDPLIPAPTGGADLIIDESDVPNLPDTVTFTLRLDPPDTQRVGYYLGAVTVTAQAVAP